MGSCHYVNGITTPDCPTCGAGPCTDGKPKPFVWKSPENPSFSMAIIYKAEPPRKWWEFWKPKSRPVALIDFETHSRVPLK